MINTSCSVFLQEFASNGILSTAYYSHLVPVAIALFLGFYGLIKARFSLLSVIFCLFTASFCLWLLGDMVTWTTPHYRPIIFFWSWLDYANVVFFALGVYFFGVLSRGDISVFEKVILVVVSVPAFLLSVTGHSVSEFYQPACEVIENGTTTFYKLVAEVSYVVMILVSFFIAFPKADRAKKIQISVVMSAMLLFFAVFSLTEYIATITDIYEINLYGLFVLPIFLIVMVFAIANLGVLKVRFLGTQILVYTLIIMIGSQFLFLESSTDAALNIITLFVTVFFSLILLRNTKKELEARIQIEKLASDLGVANTRLQELDKQKTEFISFASHQLRSPLTAMKGYASLILEGDYGAISDDLKKAARVIFDSTKTLAAVVDDYLNVSRIELGQMKYEFASIDLKSLVQDVVDELKPNVEKAGLTLEFKTDPAGTYFMSADKEKLKQVISNVIDNSVKYTPKGSIAVELTSTERMIKLVVKDTGIGISPEVISKLFSKFSRASNANKTNMRGTGLGLFIAKEIVTAHGGKIWVESEGDGKGSTFFVELKKSNG
jgi:signal transduction histidine kinase